MQQQRKPRHILSLALTAFFTGAMVWGGSSAIHGQDQLAELRIAPEHRCSPYERQRDYRYPQSIETRIVRQQGGLYGPYTGRWFQNRGQTDIEHVVAAAEAHDSGLCARDRATRTRFAQDLLNLTLAGPNVNRQQKSDRDAGEWLPAMNRCWYADRIVAVKRRYQLSIDPQEARALREVLQQCQSTEMVVTERRSSPTPPPVTPGTGSIRQWDDNGDGRITCAEARRHGIAPVHRNHPAYPYMRDGDGDGVVCE